MTDPITPSPELAAIVQRWLHAYGRGDKETVVNLLSEDAALGYVGSGHGEVWRGDALRRALPEYMDDIPRFDWHAFDVRGFERGSLGWVEWICEDLRVDTGIVATIRSTFVLALEKGVWRIVHIHHSIPISNLQAMGYEPRGFEELLDAALAAPMPPAQTGIASIMFTDIADSTTLAETLGDARWSEAVRRHVAEVRAIIDAHGGQMLKSLGDGTMSAFPAAGAALTAAIAIQRRVTADETEPRLRIRVGLHTGDLVREDDDVFGTVVNKAARVAATARPGEICVSDATRIMVGGAADLVFGEAATVPLKGLDGEHVIHRLEWST